MPGKISFQSKCVSYCYDESLPPSIGDILKAVDFPVVLATKGTQDEDLICEMGRRGQTWITRGIFKKCVNSQAVYPLSERHGLEAQERR